MFAVVLGVNAQRRMQVWEGNTYMQFFTTDVDSVTFLSFPEGILQECEEIHDTIVKTVTVHDTVTLTVRDTITKTVTVRDTITQIVKDTVYIQHCHDTVSDKPLVGAFSVSATKQVRFSRGNLQYTQSTQTWSFADNQYDMIDEANVNGNTLADKIDLFGWSGSTGGAKWGISTSTDYSDYSGDFVDWGTNTIGTDAPNTWRTLTYDEWHYIFYNRTDAQRLFGLGSVNGVNGTIILPDGWTIPAGVTFTPSTEKGLNQGGYYHNSNGDNYSHNTYTLSDWQKMEEAGATFLPAAGRSYGLGVAYVQYQGYYWSSTAYGSIKAYPMYFDENDLLYPYVYNRYYRHSVRLVQDL